MFKNKNVEFWFWFLLACINLFTIIVAVNHNDDFTCILGSCMLLLCFAKALVCAIEIDKNT